MNGNLVEVVLVVLVVVVGGILVVVVEDHHVMVKVSLIPCCLKINDLFG